MFVSEGGSEFREIDEFVGCDPGSYDLGERLILPPFSLVGSTVVIARSVAN